MIAVLPALARPFVEPHLPPEIEARWFSTSDEANRMIADAEIAWVDMQPPQLVGAALDKARQLKWVATIYAGLDAFPLAHLERMGATLTNGSGINAAAVADYAVMSVLVAAKRFDKVLRANDKREWLRDAPGKTELDATKALIIGYGTIGRMIGERLQAFGVSVTGVRRTPADGAIGPDDWRPRLGEYDWVILAAPSTAGTRAMIGDKELRAMRRSAWLINIARGDMIDAGALADALGTHRIGGAVLDTTDPEPLPAGHRLWAAPNSVVTMHLSGRSQTSMFRRAAELFVENLGNYRAGRPLRNAVDLAAGY